MCGSYIHKQSSHMSMKWGKWGGERIAHSIVSLRVGLTFAGQCVSSSHGAKHSCLLLSSFYLLSKDLSNLLVVLSSVSFKWEFLFLNSSSFYSKKIQVYATNLETTILFNNIFSSENTSYKLPQIKCLSERTLISTNALPLNKRPLFLYFYRV